MNRPNLLFTVALLLLGTTLMGQSADPWAIKKQRKETVQQPSFPYQTRNGAKAVARHRSARLASPLASPLSLTPRFRVKGPNHEPPHEIKGVLPATARTHARSATDLLNTSQHYLQEVSTLMQIRTPDQEFVAQQKWKDTRGMQHLRMQQQYQGVPVYGSEIIVHADQANRVQGLNGRYIASPQLNTVPSVSEQAAIRTSLAYFENKGALKQLNRQQQQLLNYTGPAAKLVILPPWEAGKPTLAWRVVVRPNFLDHWEMFVDAYTGKLVSQTNMTCTFAPELHTSGKTEEHHHHAHRQPLAAPFRTTAAGRGNGVDLNGVNQTLDIWQLGGAAALVNASKDMFKSSNNTPVNELQGVLITYDADRVPNPETITIVNETGTTFRDPAAVSAHYNASLAYDYFRTKHNRTSIDGRGGNVLSIVNVVEEDGSEMDNAYWNGEYMAYGNGNVGFKPLAGGTDVGGHEMSHGVIGSTAGLVYRDQSGAINEHIADVFGVLIDADNFTLGEDVVLPGVFPSGAMRDMEDPHNGGGSLDDNGWQPDHMREIYTGSQDNGGVHINSGIPNRAFFLIATELGRDKAGAIYYEALTNYLTASAQFIDLRRALINAANELYGDVEVLAIAGAFDAVGITDGDTDPDDGGGGENPIPDDGNDDLPTIGGEDLLLTVNTDPDDENSLYLINLSQDGFDPISVTPIKRKPTVVDDGSAAFFVTEDETIRGIDLAPPYEEISISEESLWANLSISKDGNRLAIISNQQQPEIWVADLTREENSFMKFELFNPTSQEGIVTYDVQYADAIEWDYSGEYLIYDAFNQVSTTGIERDVEYWDVNFIRVWDNTADDFGDGAITKIFSNLPEGTSIGNPSFSKTNRNIVCFDLFDQTNETYLIIAADLETGETKTVYENNTLGFPNYSNDDRFMVFDALNEDGTPVVAQIPLAENKLEAAGEPVFPYIEAHWTTWFSQGERVINSAENELFSFEIQTAPGKIEDRKVSVSVPDTLDVTRLVATFEQSQGATVYVGDFRQISGITSNDFSNEVTYTVVAENGDKKEYTVSVEQETTPPGPGNPDPDNPGDPDNPDPDEVVGVEDEVTKAVLVHPNPFDQEIFLDESLAGKPVKLTLYDVLGQRLPLKKHGNSFRVTQPISPGIYLLTIQHDSYERTIRLIKKY